MKKIFLLLPIVALMISCGGEAEGTTENSDETSSVVSETEPEVVPEISTDEEIEAYLSDNGWEATRDESGLYIVMDEAGEGEERPTLSDDVTIFYQGYLLDGFKFDGTSEDPATFPLMNLIQGWQIGIPYFGRGGSGKLIIPSGMAYGDRDSGDIPGGSTLMFEIDLIDFTVY